MHDALSFTNHKGNKEISRNLVIFNSSPRQHIIKDEPEIRVDSEQGGHQEEQERGCREAE